jgi:hypothetical protein
MGLRAKMVLSATFTVLAEAFVVLLILSIIGLPLIDFLFISGLFWLFQWLVGPLLIARNSRENLGGRSIWVAARPGR